MAERFNYPQDPTLGASPGQTPSQTVGPFFHYALPYEAGTRVAGARRPGSIRLGGRVLDGAGAPIADSMVEIWQADESGVFVTTPRIYEVPEPGGFRGFGRCATGPGGEYEFHTVKPAAVATVDGRAQAPHIAMAVFARGMLRQAVTRVYFDDEADANSADPLLSGLTPQRRATMVATRTGDEFRFDVRLQGDDETVFLDVFTR